MPFVKGHKDFVSPEARKRAGIKSSKAHKGKILSDETKRKIGIAHLGKMASPETRKKLSISHMGHPGYWKGKKMTKEQREKISIGNKGKPKPWFLGRKLTEEHRMKVSIALRGDKAPNWKGGISTINSIIRGSVEYKIWREKIFRRDNFTCVECGDSRGGNLEADHIKQFAYFPELRFVVENGRTLCKDCHRKTPNWGHQSKEKVYSY